MKLLSCKVVNIINLPLIKKQLKTAFCLTIQYFLISKPLNTAFSREFC
jgi:hypothetical protein